METIHEFKYFRLHFENAGQLERQEEFDEFRTAAGQATDTILIAHGFRNDETAATGLYTRLLQTLRDHLKSPEFQSTLGTRKFVIAGVYWTSKAFAEGPSDDAGSVQGLADDHAQIEKLKAKLEDMKATEACPEQKPKIDKAIELLPDLENNTALQDEFVSLVLSLLDGAELDATEGVDDIRARPGSEVLDSLSTPIILPVADADDEGSVMTVTPVLRDEDGGGDGMALGFGTAFDSVFGKVGQLLNMTTWYVMKDRAGTVGANGVAKVVWQLKASVPAIRVHLVGHSLGGRLMAACAKSLAQSPSVQPDSLILLQAAFSHYGFSADNGKGTPGFFRDVIAQKVVKGPLLATFSAQDTVVGKAYAISSRLAGDNVKAIGDANDQFGGIGRNGSQKAQESAVEKLHQAGTKYTNIKTGVIVNLDGSGGLITSHGDITNQNVTYAVASAIALT